MPNIHHLCRCLLPDHLMNSCHLLQMRTSSPCETRTAQCQAPSNGTGGGRPTQAHVSFPLKGIGKKEPGEEA